MSSTQSQQTIVVVGATGIQGSGVVRALLSDEYGGPWFVRALTQDPSSGKAQKLLSEYQTTDNRLSLVSGHIYDETSLRSAFMGAHGVFAMTSERYPGKLITEEEELKHEIDAGCNIISAAKECCIKHLVFSSLPDTVKASDGQFKRIHHMNNKHTIEQLARKELDGFTSLMPEDGVVQFCMPLPRNKMVQWTDPAHDIGAFSASVKKTIGKTYLALGPRITPEGMAKAFTRVTGKPAVHSPISFEEFGHLSSALVGPAFKEDAIEMMQWAAIAPTDKTCHGAFELEVEQSSEELGLTGSSFEDWLRRSGWTGP
ncbi:putative cinnamoyl-CoA reductase [Talaromyces proteolyticus]|uniref:Cinnamoyl-CoA reductase n=1 Tax=Talaromyces proteolyticus TaxID=1131652 RepID=A0AAD4KHK9_9EURO|nr:putative cinnamoyl-CoA reductase [Talaromyces proteolyticus]KAH8688646.1 putative cinnamoyl-CoA reductase [Talaromyces proteolyticus]